MSAVVGLLVEKLRNRDQQVMAATRVLEQIRTSSITEVADFVGLSTRQFERRFIAAVGIPPKLFCRMQRFQRVLRAMESSNCNWVDVAVNCGYYDQFHLIRDFHEFAGEAPSSITSHEIHLARQFARG